MKWYHLIAWGGIVFTHTSLTAVNAKMDELHLTHEDASISISHTAL